MAGETDRPGAAGPAVPPVPAVGPPPEETYRPLSGLALAGFGLSALYAAIVFGGGLVSFLGRVPWLLPGWTVLLAAAGLFVSWVARNRIRDSEGTLSGSALAAWGLGLSFTAALLYHAYYAATYFAVKHQATEFADRWLALLREGKFERAFLLTVAPPRPADGPELRATLETLYNTPGAAFTPGQYTTFCQSEYTLLLAQGGPEADVRRVGVRDWDYEQGGYRVRLQYRVSTPMVATDLVVTVQGNESPAGEYSGRQWFVVREETGLPQVNNKELTPQGRALLQTADEAYSFARAWLDRLSRGEREEAYLETLPPAERPRARQALRDGKAAGAPRDYAAGFKAFAAGGIIDADPDRFFAARSLRAELVEDVRKAFDPTSKTYDAPALMKSSYPIWERAGERVRFRFPVMVRAQGQRHAIEGELVVSAPVPDLNDRRPKAWQVEGLQLTRGRVVNPPGGPGSPPG